MRRLRVQQVELRHPFGVELVPAGVFVGWIVFAGLVVRSEGVDGVDQPQRSADLRHVRREFLLLHRHHQLLPFAEPFGGAGRAVGQHGAEPLTPGDLFQQRQHGVGVAEPEIQPIRFLFGEEPMLVSIHGPGDGGSGAYGVQPVPSADLVGLGDGFQVVDAAVGAEGGQGLVLRPAEPRVHRESVAFDLHHALATDHACVARFPFLQDRFGHSLAADLFGPFEIPAAVVERWKPAPLVLAGYDLGGAEEPHAVDVRILEVLRAPSGQFRELLRVRGRRFLPAGDHHRLQVLAPHDRAHAGPAVGAAGIAHDVRQQRHFLPRRADLHHVEFLGAQLLPQGVLHFPRFLAPEVGGVTELRLAVLDPEVDWLRRSALHHDGVEPGGFHLGREISAGLRIADGAGFRGFGGDGEPALAGDRRSGDDTEGEDQDVLRPQWICSGRHSLQDVVERQGAAAHVPPVELLVRFFDRQFPFRQVYVQDLSVVPVWHVTPFHEPMAVSR